LFFHFYFVDQSASFSAEALAKQLLCFWQPASEFVDSGRGIAAADAAADAAAAAADARVFVRGLLGLWRPTPTGVRSPVLVFEHALAGLEICSELPV
jgi:hypothetical protein